MALDSGRLDSLGREPRQLIILSERFRDSAWLLDFRKELWESGAHKSRCSGTLTLYFPFWCNRIIGCWVGGNTGNDLVLPTVVPSLQQPLTCFLIITSLGAKELLFFFHQIFWESGKGQVFGFSPFPKARFTPLLWLLYLNFSCPKSKVKIHYAKSSETHIEYTM